MNQPYPGPGNQASAGGYGQQDAYGQQYEVSYPPPQSAPFAPTFAPSGPPAGPPPSTSRLPMWIAAGLVLALAVGLTLFFVLRGGGSGTGTEADDKPTAKEVTKDFFVAVDEMDESAMKKLTRGEVTGDIDAIMAGDAQEAGVSFADGKVTDSALKKTDGIRLSVVVWELANLPDDLPSSDAELMVLLLDDGEGFKVCNIDTADGGADGMMEDFADEYPTVCDYKD